MRQGWLVECRLPYRIHLGNPAPGDSVVARLLAEQADSLGRNRSNRLYLQEPDSVARASRARADSLRAEREAIAAGRSGAEAAAAAHAAAEQARADWQPRCDLQLFLPHPLWAVPAGGLILPGDAPGIDIDDVLPLSETLKRLEPPWQFWPLRIEAGFEGFAISRFNRVEGPSFSGQAVLDLGRLSADAMARLAGAFTSNASGPPRSAASSASGAICSTRTLPSDPTSSPTAPTSWA